MPVRTEKNSALKQVLGVVLMVAVAMAVAQVLQSSFVQDSWRGVWYEPSEKVLALEDALELTGEGKRIFRATMPEIEGRDEFNANCENHKVEVALLGCYTEGKIHVYEITMEQLADSNKVTAAHELLHAVWERTSAKERARLEELLREVERENQEWFETELQSYAEQDRLEEVYTRAGTKLRDLPEELEEHYAKYFQNRLKIVEFYENYQAPFRELQEKNAKLETLILTTKAEIAKEREEYIAAVEVLDEAIEEFNRCAEEPGCFSAERFNTERQRLATEKARLDAKRVELNDKIEENNARVIEYQENQAALGELSDAMNSNIMEEA